MIRKLRFEFIGLAMMAVFILLAVIITSMNLLNYHAVVAEADQTLSILARNRGVFPDFEDNKRPPNMSPEAPYEARYFSVLIGKNNEVIQVDTGRIKAVDTQQAMEYAIQAASENKERGFLAEYRYVCHSEGLGTRISFLDCGRKLNAFHTFQLISVGMALVGYAMFFVVILFFSGKMIRPVAESYEKQKQFITDAGHELKTPLTIIKADVEVLEMELGENEWITDIQKQVKRLTTLTNDLVFLSRVEEANEPMQMIEFPLSDVVSEAAASFQTLAQTQGKTFHCNIQPMLSLKGNDKAIHQLVGILLDNALKYSSDHGTVSLALERQNKTIQLYVFNTTENIIETETLNRLFERFYRIDASRNSQTGGYGIGLSIAKAIVEAHNGKIQAKTEDGHSLQIMATFPIS